MKGPMSEGMGMPPMMRQVMEKMMAEMKDVNPMAMCQAMMTSASKSAEAGAFATSEVRTLFEEWAQSVQNDILTALKERGEADLDQLAARVKLSPESLTHFLGRLVRERKVSISAIRPAPGEPSKEA